MGLLRPGIWLKILSRKMEEKPSKETRPKLASLMERRLQQAIRIRLSKEQLLE